MPNADDVFRERPETLHLDGLGELPVEYIEETEEELPRVGPGDVFLHTPGVAWTVLGHEVVVYDRASTTTHVLDQVAGLLWQCLDGESTLHDIFSDLADAFGQQLDTIVTDLATVVATWKQAGIVALAGEPSVDETSLAVQSVSAGAPWTHLVDPPND